MKLKTNKNHQLRFGLFFIGFILVFMLLCTFFRDISIEVNMEERLEPFSSNHLVGTDDLGRDFLSCILYGAGISMLIGFTVVLLSVLIGALLGMVSGFAGGVTDMIIMRMVDIILSFPGILLALALVSFFQQGIVVLILALTFAGWAGCARIVRGEILKYKQMEFIRAARSYNASFSRIILSHLLPITLPLIVVQASLGISGVILAESSLSFLGIGIDPRLPTLGQLIDAGRDHLFDKPHLIVIPGLVLFFIIIGFNFIGEGLRKRFTR